MPKDLRETHDLFEPYKKSSDYNSTLSLTLSVLFCKRHDKTVKQTELLKPKICAQEESRADQEINVLSFLQRDFYIEQPFSNL